MKVLVLTYVRISEDGRIKECKELFTGDDAKDYEAVNKRVKLFENCNDLLCERYDNVDVKEYDNIKLYEGYLKEIY